MFNAAMETGVESEISALQKAGITDRSELARLIVWRGGTILGEVCHWGRGEYTLDPGAAVPDKIPRSRLRILHRPRTSWRDVEIGDDKMDFLERSKSMYLSPGPNANRIIESMDLQDKETRFVGNLVKKPIQIREAFTISPLYRNITRKILYFLIDSGAFSLSETNPRGSATVPLEELENYLKSMERDDDFSVLAIHPSSTATEIRQRFEKRLAQFDNSVYPGAGPEQSAVLERIKTRISKAFETMKDDKRRREYRDRIYSQDQLNNFFDLQLRKAEMALRVKGNAREALEFAVSAVELRPESSEARLVLAGSFVAIGNTAEARRQLLKIKAVPERLRTEMERVKRLIGAF